MKRFISYFLKRYLDVKVVKINYKEGSSAFNENPLELFYLYDQYSFKCKLPISKGRSWRWFALDGQVNSPFYIATKLVNECSDVDPILVAEEVLRKYSQLTKIETASEALGLVKNEHIYDSSINHPMAVVMPWDNITVADSFNSWKLQTIKENSMWGLDSETYLGAINPSQKKTDMEARRTVSLISSIKEKGLIYSERDNIGAVLLTKGSSYRWYVRGGQHRSAIAAGLGYEYLDVNISRVVTREHVSSWPNVASGLYNVEAALCIFDRIFHSEPPPAYLKWSLYCEEVNEQT